MNAVVIDVSKGKSMVVVLRPFGVVVTKSFEVGHTAAELGKLADFLKSLDGETKVVMEHTGRYYEPVAQVIHDQSLFVSVVNPLLIREYGGNSLRRVKTDKADAKKIARYGLDNWAELREYSPMDTIRYELKTLNRQFQLASKNRTACSNTLLALLDQSFPGANGWFESPVRKDGSQKWVDFIMTFWHVDCVRSASQAAFTERYRKWCKHHGYNFSAAKSEQIHREAREMVALVPKSAPKQQLRKELSEHPFGTVKWADGAHYFLCRGKEKVAAEIALSFLAYDLRRAMRLTTLNPGDVPGILRFLRVKNRAKRAG